MATRWASARPSRTVLDGPSIGTSMGNWSMGLDELSHRARNTRDLAHSLHFLFYLENYSDFFTRSLRVRPSCQSLDNAQS